MLLGLSILITNNMANKLVPVTSLELLPRPVVDLLLPVETLVETMVVIHALVPLRMELMLKLFNKVLIGSVAK